MMVPFEGTEALVLTEMVAAVEELTGALVGRGPAASLDLTNAAASSVKISK